MRRVLVTGASGFVGRALVPALATAGWRVRAAMRDPVGAAAHDHVEAVRLPDLTAPIDWAPLLADVEAVVHLAAIAHRSSDASLGYDAVNRRATGDLARACAAITPSPHLIFVSSIGAQAGSSSEHVLRETDPPHPGTPYERAKLAAEEEVRASGAEFTILRPVLIHGEGVKANMAALIRLAASPWPLPFGALANCRSLVALANLIGAISFCLERPCPRGETYIVADPEALTLAEMITTMRGAIGRSPGLVRVPPVLLRAMLIATGRGAMWERLGGELVADPAKLIAAGWRPAVTTRDALAATMRSHAQARAVALKKV